MARYTQAQIDAALATHTQAECARILGAPGKSFRDVTRGKFGTFVSRDVDGADAAWTRVRAYRVAYANTEGTARDAVRDAWTHTDDDGKPSPLPVPEGALQGSDA